MAGCMTLADMHKPEYHSTLTEAQKIGLRFVDQIPEPVTREQAETVLVGYPGSGCTNPPVLNLRTGLHLREHILEIRGLPWGKLVRHSPL